MELPGKKAIVFGGTSGISLASAATGGTRAIEPFMSMDLDGYQASFVNLWGHANVVGLGGKHLSEKGCIVLVSGSPARKCKPGQVALRSVGAAVEALARVVAAEIARRRINAVSPGAIDTPMVALQGEQRSALYKKMTASHLIPRAGTPDEVAKGIHVCNRKRLHNRHNG